MKILNERDHQVDNGTIYITWCDTDMCRLAHSLPLRDHLHHIQSIIPMSKHIHTGTIRQHHIHLTSNKQERSIYIYHNNHATSFHFVSQAHYHFLYITNVPVSTPPSRSQAHNSTNCHPSLYSSHWLSYLMFTLPPPPPPPPPHLLYGPSCELLSDIEHFLDDFHR